MWAGVAAAAHDTYTNVRDHWRSDELDAWVAYIDARAKAEKSHKR